MLGNHEYNYKDFCKDVGDGNVEALRSCAISNTQINEFIMAKNYAVFRIAADNGKLDVLRYLEEKAPDKLPAMIASKNYDAFIYAAG